MAEMHTPWQKWVAPPDPLRISGGTETDVGVFNAPSTQPPLTARLPPPPPKELFRLPGALAAEQNMGR